MANVKEGILVGCGNPLLDISAVVKEDLLRKYDLKPDDAILAEDKHTPLYDELINNYNAEYIAGGSVQNSLRVCQWLLQKPLSTVFFGCVGDDKFAKILRERAGDAGVNVQYQVTNEVPTGTCAVLINGTHRSLCANLAAANHFTLDHLTKASSQEYIKNAEYFYISGFFLTVSPPSIMSVAEYAHSNSRLFMMNLSAPFISKIFQEPLMNALPYVDILFGNNLEAEAFAEAQGWETRDIVEIGKKILDIPKLNTSRPRIAVLTQGSEPVLLIQKDKISEFPVHKLKPEQVVDTNGAGDAFVGGFLSQLVQNKTYDVCIRAGIWSARKIIQRSGCTYEGLPDFHESDS